MLINHKHLNTRFLEEPNLKEQLGSDLRGEGGGERVEGRGSRGRGGGAGGGAREGEEVRRTPGLGGPSLCLPVICKCYR